jgi:putative DNA primase/helicase
MTTEADITKVLVAAALGDWKMKLRVNDRMKLIECWQNVYTILDNHPEWKGVLALDTFAQRIVKRKPPPFERGATVGAWTPEDDAELGLWLAAPNDSTCFVVKGKQALMDGVSACAARHKFHPVREYIETRKAPDRSGLD